MVRASGDATLDRVGAVDWTSKEAYSLEVKPYQQLLEEMEKVALADPSGPRRVSRPGCGDCEEQEPAKMMVALTELLAVLLLAVSQCDKWKGKIILYMGDNQVVIKWINSRQAKHPFAGFLLQALAAVEAHGIPEDVPQCGGRCAGASRCRRSDVPSGPCKAPSAR